MRIEVANGEVFDKISILKIKLEKISDIEKSKHIRKEYDYLVSTLGDLSYILNHSEFRRLNTINRKLWDSETKMREYSKQENINAIELAQEAHFNHVVNDQRYECKRNIDKLTNSNFQEQKNHESCV